MKTEIVLEAARLFRVPYAELVGRARCNHHMPPRFALYKALQLRGWSTNQIGDYLGRDRSTVTYGIRRAEQIMAGNKSYTRKIEQIAAWKPTPLDLEAA